MIYGCHGIPRSGKTLWMTFVAFNSYLMGKKIFSNYQLMFPTLDELDDMGLVDFYKENFNYDISKVNLQKPEPLDLDYVVDNFPDSAYELRFASLFMDELWTFMDARMSMDKKSILLGYLMLQTGKHHVDIFYSSQQARLVDLRAELNTNYQVFFERIPQDPTEDLQGVYIKVWDNMKKEYIGRKVWTNFQLYFSMYDTEQVIARSTSHDKDKREGEILRKVKELGHLSKR
jgi:hypothetical protein